MIDTRPEYPPEFDEADPQDIIDDLRKEVRQLIVRGYDVIRIAYEERDKCQLETARLNWLIRHDQNRSIDQYPNHWEAYRNGDPDGALSGSLGETAREAIDAAISKESDDASS